MNWQPVDCHAHTTFSDGELSVAQLVDRAAALGVTPSVSDHISRDVAKSITSVPEVRLYLETLERFDVLRAGEFCWHDDLWRQLPDDLVRGFTHRIGSLHAIALADGTLVHAFARHPPVGLTAKAYMDAHIAALEQMTLEMPVDILAHPTLIAHAFRADHVDLLWTESRESRMAEALYDAGIAFEVSARYPPHERIVRRMFERGVRLSLASDGHTRDQVANVAKPLALARKIGVRDDQLYDPRRHGSKTGGAYA